MSRSGYTDDGENLDLYRANVGRAIKGKRGQKFLVDMARALDAMPAKRLIADDLVDEDGEPCAIGAVCQARGIDVAKIDYYDPQSVAEAVGVPWCLAAEIEYENDEHSPCRETPEQRWIRMRAWVSANLEGR